MSLPEENVALLMILAGPTGTGKSTICDGMTAKYSGIKRVVTSTTRPPREGEVEGVDYFFFSEETFEKKLKEDAFYEHARVHAHRYGTLKSEIQENLSQNIDLIMNIDVQGVAFFQKAATTDTLLRKRLVTVFIMPPSLDVIERRLVQRGKEDREAMARRLDSARREMKLWTSYDFCLVTGSKEEDLAKVESIWKAEKLRVARHST